MDWITLTWPMVAAGCLTLGLVELRVGLTAPRDRARLLFAVSAFACAAECGMELAAMHAASPEQFQTFLRIGDVMVAVMLAALVGFVWLYFGTGKRWLAIAGPAVYAVALLFDFIPGSSLAYLEPTHLRSVQTFGGASFHVLVGVPNPWNILPYVAALLVLAFVLHAAVELWRRGTRRRAAVIGGGVALWLLVGGTFSALIEAGILQMPYVISVAYIAVLLAMSYELTADLAAAERLARELQESERRMELASEAAALGMWSWDISTDRMWTMGRTRQLLGLSESPRLTMPRYLKVIHPDDRDRVRATLDRARQFGGDYQVEHRVPLRDGETRWIVARGQVELDRRGQPTRVRGMVADISERRRAELELRELQGRIAHASRVSQLGQLTSALAHELAQPLGAILRNAEAAALFLDCDPPNLGELHAILTDIRADDQRACDVIARLRGLLKRQGIEAHPLAIGDVLRDVAMLAGADATARGIVIEMDCTPDLPVVMGDGVHLRQVLLNLVLNAMDAVGEATADRRRVTVQALNHNGRAVEVVVSDSGHGVPPEILGQVFEPFFTTKASGMGIGLAISRTIIEAHGGRIWAESRGEQGATFRFVLPSAAEHAKL